MALSLGFDAQVNDAVSEWQQPSRLAGLQSVTRKDRRTACECASFATLSRHPPREPEMATTQRVFICSTQVDLLDERAGVIDAIARLQLQHEAMEYFGARPNQPLSTCIEHVRS